MIRHIVLFSANPGRIDDIERALRALERIPNAALCQVRRNLRLDSESREIDIIVYAEFTDEGELRAFKANEIYQRAVEVVKPQRELRLVADCEI